MKHTEVSRPSEGVEGQMTMREGLRDAPGPKGRVKMFMNGELFFEDHNVVTNQGHIDTAHRFLGDGSPPDVISHVAIGSGTSDLNDAAQTALGTELARVAITTNYPARTDNEIEVRASFPPGTGTGTISEAGIFNANSAGNMWARSAVAPARVKSAADTLDIVWTLTF